MTPSKKFRDRTDKLSMAGKREDTRRVYLDALDAPPSTDEAIDALRAEMEAVFSSNSQRAQLLFGARVLRAQSLALCQEVHAHVAPLTLPDKGAVLNQIGAGFFFVGEYAAAIRCYEEAGAAGADPRMVADNIQEAREALEARGEG